MSASILQKNAKFGSSNINLNIDHILKEDISGI